MAEILSWIGFCSELTELHSKPLPSLFRNEYVPLNILALAQRAALYEVTTYIYKH